VDAQAELGKPAKRLWEQDASIRNTYKAVIAGGTPWLPTGDRIGPTFPPDSVFSVVLWTLNDWSGVTAGGGQWHRVPDSNGAVILG
jgi:hypothetical protein